MFDPTDIFGGVAVSSGNTYKSRVSRSSKRHFYQASTTGDVAGPLAREVNTLSDADYAVALAAVAAAHPSYTPAEVEAANTTGWATQSFLQSDVTNLGATLSMASAASFTANMPPGPRRSRLSFAPSGGSGTLSVLLHVS
jgi:hypothetical protein